jgi:eukaryotic-like serine/threonine-protein kinase
VLSAAAVVGRAFDLSLLGAACGLPVQQVLGALSEDAGLGVVTEEPGAIGLYRFSHPLMRESLYERLPLPARMELHRRVGEAIEARHGAASGADLAELSHHFAIVAPVGHGAKALEYARGAGDRAMAMHAYDEAAAQYERALRVLELADAGEALRCELLLRQGEARSRAGDHAQARESFLQAAELSSKHGSPEQLGRAALGYGEPQVEGGLSGVAELNVHPDLGDAGELLDAMAKAAYRARLEELRADLEEAERFSDPGRAARSRQEIDFLEDELARAVGLGGRDRRAAAHAERARLNVTRAIRAGLPTSPGSTRPWGSTSPRPSGRAGTARTRPTPGRPSPGGSDGSSHGGVCDEWLLRTLCWVRRPLPAR